MSHNLDPELLIAQYKQFDYERAAKKSRQVREAKGNQSSWLTRPGSLLRGKGTKADVKWDTDR